MKPWFIDEAEIIKFPTKKSNVVTMPNVNSYPDFITGVRDLQAKLKDKTISTDSYNKLYTDLINRFRVQRESADKPWFLRELDDRGIMSVIKARLKDPNIDTETLQKVLFALEGGGLTKRLQNVLENDPDAKRILEKVTETILQAKGTTEEIDQFIKQYPKGMVKIS